MPKSLPSTDQMKRELDAYHGSPHRFPPTKNNPLGEFDASKIGTGEGAQAYGHGLYLAENPNVAKDYAIKLGMNDRKFIVNGAEVERGSVHHQAAQAIYDDGKTSLFNVLNLDPQAKKIAEQLKNSNAKIEANAGSLYKVGLPEEQIAKMLDWDKPLSEQPVNIQQWLKDIHNPHRKHLTAPDIGGNEPTGGLMVNRLQELMSEGKKSDVFTNAANFGLSNASREMREAGIPGIKYLDAGSRHQPTISMDQLKQSLSEAEAAHKNPPSIGTERFLGTNAGLMDKLKKQIVEYPKPTRNFVVFPGNEHMMKIVHREAKGGLVHEGNSVHVIPHKGEKPIKLKDYGFNGGGDVHPTKEQAAANKKKYLAESTEKRRLYHGSRHYGKNGVNEKLRSEGGIKEFSTGNRGMTFLTPSKGFANEYAGGSKLRDESSGAVYPVHVQVKNPFDYENPEHVERLAKHLPKADSIWSVHHKKTPTQIREKLATGDWSWIEDPQVIQTAKKLGHDAMYMQEIHEGFGKNVKNLGVFDPRYIKSAIGNRGTYDTEDYDITKAKGGRVGKAQMQWELMRKKKG